MKLEMLWILCRAECFSGACSWPLLMKFTDREFTNRKLAVPPLRSLALKGSLQVLAIQTFQNVKHVEKGTSCMCLTFSLCLFLGMLLTANESPKMGIYYIPVRASRSRHRVCV